MYLMFFLMCAGFDSLVDLELFEHLVLLEALSLFVLAEGVLLGFEFSGLPGG